MTLGCTFVGVIDYQSGLCGWVDRLDTKTAAGQRKMREIALAIQDGTKAYLNRQVITISVISVGLFILLFFKA